MLKYQIQAYLDLLSIIVERGVPEDAIYYNFTESAARPLFGTKGSVREKVTEKIVERCKQGIRTRVRDTNKFIKTIEEERADAIGVNRNILNNLVEAEIERRHARSHTPIPEPNLLAGGRRLAAEGRRLNVEKKEKK